MAVDAAPAVDEQHFRVMGSEAHLVVLGDDADLIHYARARVERLERLWSRFLPDSEISTLNRAAGQPVVVSDETETLVRQALAAFHLPGGLYDPTVLGDLLRAGYDRSFERLPADGPAPPSVLRRGADEIRVERNLVRVPADVGFDPGGIGKGLAADLITAELREAGAVGTCVNLGGDVRVAGRSPDGEGWTVAVEHPDRPEPLAHLGLADGAVASSTTRRRRWRSEGQPRHHLIDPRTGTPSASDLDFVAVVAGRAWLAEVLAKTWLIEGAAATHRPHGDTGAEALTVDRDGAVELTTGFAAYLGEAQTPSDRPTISRMISFVPP
jgi:thiamine biosynthesis lipoprotein